MNFIIERKIYLVLLLAIAIVISSTLFIKTKSKSRHLSPKGISQAKPISPKEEGRKLKLKDDVQDKKIASADLLPKNYSSTTYKNLLKQTAKKPKLAAKSLPSKKLDFIKGSRLTKPNAAGAANNPSKPIGIGSDSSGQGSLAIDVKTSHADSSDYNKDGRFNVGEMLKFEIFLKNKGDADVQNLILKSFVERDFLGYIHDIRGSGVDDSNISYLLWRDISLAKGEEKTYSYKVQIKSLNDSQAVKTQIIVSDDNNKSIANYIDQQFFIYP